MANLSTKVCGFRELVVMEAHGRYLRELLQLKLQIIVMEKWFNLTRLRLQSTTNLPVVFDSKSIHILSVFLY